MDCVSNVAAGLAGCDGRSINVGKARSRAHSAARPNASGGLITAAVSADWTTLVQVG
jgi:hypothetical protein